MRISTPAARAITMLLALSIVNFAKSGLGLSGSAGVAVAVRSNWSVVASVREMHQTLVTGSGAWWRTIQLGMQLGR